MVMVRYSKSKDMNRVVGELVKSGWEFVAGAHGRVIHPSGKYLTFSTSPSDKYAHKQLERDVRRLLKTIEETHDNN